MAKESDSFVIFQGGGGEEGPDPLPPLDARMSLGDKELMSLREVIKLKQTLTSCFPAMHTDCGHCWVKVKKSHSGISWAKLLEI